MSRRIRIIHLCPWADDLEPASDYLARQPSRDLRSRVSNPQDAKLLLMARLDCDWHAENLRAFAAMEHPEIEFLPALVTGTKGLPDMAFAPIPADEERWFIPMAQHLSGLTGVIGRLLEIFASRGGRTLFWAFDAASERMGTFPEVAPHLDIYIHDEILADSARALLRPGCKIIHRSWVANIVPFAHPFVEEPGERILFLGSEMGLTPHRQQQVDFLKKKFGEKFTAYHDHSFPVGERGKLSRFKVNLCPEGRMFAIPSMSRTHTDRPFWSGCLGLVPVIEDSQTGGRLAELQQRGLVIPYKHGDLDSLGDACERALQLDLSTRCAIYEHFNRFETVGPAAAQAIFESGRLAK